MRKKWYLHDNWKVKIEKIGEYGLPESFDPSLVRDWFPAFVPGTIHTDLLTAKIIEDPFVADNEKKLQWVHESDWLYWTEFDLPEDAQQLGNLSLVFEGLDTVATIELNGQTVGDANNMFRRYRLPISDLIKPKGNVLRVLFKSPVQMGKDLIKRFGKLYSVRFEERVYLRKAQYSFGWDWGPSLPTVGIWRPVYLESQEKVRIESVRFETLEIKDGLASVAIKVGLGGELEEDYKIECDLSYHDQNIHQGKSISGLGQVKVEMEMQNPALWWPSGQGNQPLYDLDVSLLLKGNKIDQSHCKVGIRTIELIQQEGKKQVFYFRVNNKPVYMKGANWIPSESFIPRIKDSTYETLITMAKESGMNMLRIWGGGIYEQPIFYNLCDELGLLIWQDFMFACSSYPENDPFMDNIREEAREKVLELQHHPSIAIWCGNNENEWIWYREDRGSYKNMPGFNIFHHELKKIVEELDPHRSYWPTSPFGLEEDPNAMGSGNRHSWDIWSRWVDYQNVEHDYSLFVSEFGFQGPANMSTLNCVLEEKNRHVQNEIFEFHNKQVEGNERLFKFLAGHLPVRTEWEDFIYLTQLNQGFALKTCLEHWRQRWPDTAGSLIWQLNDCWPVTSWSLIDSQLNPKLAYFFVKGIFSEPSILHKYKNNQINVYLANERNDEFHGIFEYLILDLSDFHILRRAKKEIYLQGRVRIQEDYISLMNLPISGNWILITTLYDNQGCVCSRNYFTLKKWKHLQTLASDVKLISKGENKLTLKSNNLGLFVDLYHWAVRFSNRGIIMLPGEQIDLEIISEDLENINIADIKIFTLNDYLF